MVCLRTLRNIALFASVTFTAACQSTTMPVSQGSTDESVAVQRAEQSRPDRVPLDVTDLRDRFLASNPGSEGLPLIKGKRGGFVLKANGDVTYKAFRSKGNLQTNTRIISDEGNRVCVAKVRNWSGACFSLFKMADGSVRVDYEFGNGHGGSYTVSGLTL